jgi:hypothetical protein
MPQQQQYNDFPQMTPMMVPPQFPQRSMAPDPALPDWQQHQAKAMFEDQQKMITLYQQALEQILNYRNQYFQQAMEMRENLLRERE